jgi:hypothetical protein
VAEAAVVEAAVAAGVVEEAEAVVPVEVGGGAVAVAPAVAVVRAVVAVRVQVPGRARVPPARAPEPGRPARAPDRLAALGSARPVRRAVAEAGMAAA